MVPLRRNNYNLCSWSWGVMPTAGEGQTSIAQQTRVPLIQPQEGALNHE